MYNENPDRVFGETLSGRYKGGCWLCRREKLSPGSFLDYYLTYRTTTIGFRLVRGVSVLMQLVEVTT